MHKGMILLHKTVVVICIFFKCICNLQGRGKKGLRGVIKDSMLANSQGYAECKEERWESPLLNIPPLPCRKQLYMCPEACM